MAGGSGTPQVAEPEAARAAEVDAASGRVDTSIGRADTSNGRVDALFAGGSGLLEPEGRESGVFKQAVSGPVAVDRLGLRGDFHADPQAHGGPEKAVHQYAASNYRRLAAHAPEIADRFSTGSIGENISADGWDETSVHIGDVFRIGSVLLQVSQPRSPCWKIDSRYGVAGLAAFIVAQRIPGWYYRVLEPGVLEAGDSITLIERMANAPSLDHFLAVQSAHRPTLAELQEISTAPGLADTWRERLLRRLEWLQRNK